MMSLTSLDAGGNGLETLAPELSRCVALESLDVSDSKIEELPEGLSKLTKLRWGASTVYLSRRTGERSGCGNDTLHS